MNSAKFWVDYLGLEPHPEGGFYRQTYIASESISEPHLPRRYKGQRNFSTAIYFLLEHPDFSAFHRLGSDEVWHQRDNRASVERHCNIEYCQCSKGEPKAKARPTIGYECEEDCCYWNTNHYEWHSSTEARADLIATCADPWLHEQR